MKKGHYQAPRKPIRKHPLVAAMIGILAVALICGWMLFRSPSQDAVQEATSVEKLENTAAIPGFEELVLKADTKKQKVVLFNPSENTCLFRISLILEDGTVLWTSKEIKPGKDSDPIRLSQPLKAGHYPNTVLKYECFAMDRDKTPQNGAEIILTLRVQN